MERQEVESEERVRERLDNVRMDEETGRSERGNADVDGEEELTQVVELMQELYDSRCQSPED